MIHTLLRGMQFLQKDLTHSEPIFSYYPQYRYRKYHANTALKRNSYYDVALDELEECLTSASTIEQEVDAKELSQEIDRFLDSLDQESRVMFVARYWYSDSITEIAKRLRTTNNNVSVRLSRIRSKLKIIYRKRGMIYDTKNISDAVGGIGSRHIEETASYQAKKQKAFG